MIIAVGFMVSPPSVIIAVQRKKINQPGNQTASIISVLAEKKYAVSNVLLSITGPSV